MSMRQLNPAYWLGAMVLAAALTACNGGRGSSGTTPATPSPTATPMTPSPTAMPTSPAATYAGTEAVANVYDNYPPPTIDPNVTPYPNTNVTYDLSASVSSSSGGSVITTDETVTEPNEQLMTTVITDATTEPNGPVEDVAETQTSYADSDDYTQVVNYSTPFVVDEDPEDNNATWTNTAGKTTDETYSGGQTDDRTTNSDGSYSENETDSVDDIQDTATVGSNAAGSWAAAADSAGFYDGYFTGFTWTAPSGGDVTFTATESSATGCGSSCTETLAVPAFFSTNPLTLYSNSSTITTGVSYPGSCDVPSTYGTIGNQIASTTTDTDPLFGFIENTTINAYTSSTYGLVCVESTDILSTYYDWNGDDYYFLVAGSGPPFVTTTTTTRLTLASGAGVGVLSRIATAKAATSGTPSSVQAADEVALARSLVVGQAIRARAKLKELILAHLREHINGVK